MDQSPLVKSRSIRGPVDPARVTIMIRCMMAMNQRTLKAGLTTALLIVLPACASHRPSLYSNEHLMRVGSSVAERDIDQCIQQAKAASEGRENLAENAAVSPPGGAAIGAA